MSSLPTGTVTFLFTDIEGSTALWEQYPEAMARAVARHHRILQEAIQAHHGHTFNVAGDAFCAAFATAHEALAAALAVQRALVQADWGETPIRVRMGLHSGSAEATESDYRSGPTLNRVARVMSIATGGQVLLSQATAELMRGQLSEGIVLRALGTHRLKGLADPVSLLQVVAPDLPSDFPPLKSLSTIPNNLPLQLTSFVGREQEIAEVKRLLTTTRLLTLTGAGGTGKTRLALQAAGELLDDFDDGIFLISLAPVRDPALVLPAIAQVLNVREAPTRPLLDSLRDYLREKQLLLVLDNFEQVIAAAPSISDLLNSAVGLHVLVTSRELLRINGEQNYAVSPLSRPNPKQLPELAQLTQYEAVQLFIERAKAVRPNFTVTNDSAPVVADICQRLDGLPLAIELAAARVRLLTPQEMLAQLGNRLRLLTGGARDLPARQQSLHATIDWSYQLLTTDDKRLFAQLAVFVGGCTLEAAESVCDTGSSLNVLDGLQSLIDKSLLHQLEVSGEPRFSMLETIREFAHERLASSGEWRDVQERHFHFYVTLAEQVYPQLRGRQQREYLERLERDHDNFRAALDWAWQVRLDQPLLRLGAALAMFWRQRADWSEARKWFGIMLTLEPQSEHDDWRRQLLASSAYLAFLSGAYESAKQQARTCLTLSQAVGDRQREADAYLVLGATAMEQIALAEAHTLLEQAQSLFREASDLMGVADALHWLGHVAQGQGDYTRARAYFQDSYTHLISLGDLATQTLLLADLGTTFYLQEDFTTARLYGEQGLALCRALGNKYGMASVLNLLGDIARCEENDVRADALYRESLSLLQDIGSAIALGVRHNVAQVRLHQGDARQAAALFLESLGEFHARGDTPGVMDCLAGLAGAAVQLGQAERGARLLGASERLRVDLGTNWWPANHLAFKRHQASARERLGATGFRTAWQVGYAMTPEQAVTEAEQVTMSIPTAAPTYPAGLSAREVEVLRWVARGLSNQEIADQLVLSKRTVEAHLRAIFGKLDVTTRSAATRAAMEYKIV